MATVHTEYGPGQVVDRETVRGRTRFLVAGDGFKVWMDQTKVGGYSGRGHAEGDWDAAIDGPQGSVGEVEDLRRHLRMPPEDLYGDYYDENDAARYSSAARSARAPLDRGNSVTLPYDPTPQHSAVDGPGYDDDSSTIQPVHHIDPDERLSPSDSVTLDDEDDGYGDGPAPDADLFARQAAVPSPNMIKHVLDWAKDKGVPVPDGDRIHEVLRQKVEDQMRRYTDDEKVVKTVADGAEGAWEGGSAAAPVAVGQFGLNRAIDYLAPGPGYGGVIHSSSVHDANLALVGPALRLLGPVAVNGLVNSFGGGGDDEDGEGLVGRALDATDPGGYGGVIHDSSLRPAGLSDKYIDITAGADYHNDPVAQFRHDPDAYINRIGHLMDEGLNPRFAEYMELVEADGGIRTAAWKDVRKKAMRLKREGHVTVKDIAPNRIMASVVGDHGTYDVLILKNGSYGGLNEGNPGHAISNWHCGCEWGRWAFRRKYTYVGRLCSHAYASYLTMQSAALKGKPRQQKAPKRKAPSRALPFLHVKRGSPHTADNLQNGPTRLTPELIVNDTDDAHMFVDVTTDERDDVGPDDVVSEKDIVHFARLMRHCEVTEQPYPRHLVAFLARYAGCNDDHSDDTRSDYRAHDADDADGYLDEIRADGDRKQERDFGSMAERVHEIQDAVEEARGHGVDADRFVASLSRTAAEGDDYQTSQDGGRTVYRGPNNTGYVYENGRYTPVNFTGKGSQGAEGNRYEMGDGSYTRSTENGRDLYRYDGGYGNSGFAVQNGDVRGVNFTGQGEQGGNQRFDYDGDADSQLSDFRDFLQTLPAGAPADVPAAPNGPRPATPAGAPTVTNLNSEKPTSDGSGPGGGGTQTSGPVADGGRAGAENGNNAAITKGLLDADGNYTVQAGDTLTDIAQRTTGDMNKYQDIAKANSGITNVDNIGVGTKINLSDFANDTGNNNVGGNVTNPAGGGADKDVSTPDVDVSAVGQSSYANGKSSAEGAAGSAAKDTTKETTARRRRGRGVVAAEGDGTGDSSDPAEPAAPAEPGTASPGSKPAANPATKAPAGPSVSETYDPADPNDLAAQNSSAGNPGNTGLGSPGAVPQQPTQNQFGTGQGMDALNTGVGAATDVASSVAGAAPDIADAVSSVASGLGSIFASRQDFDDWVRYAYPQVEGEGDLEPHTHPFAGSGYPGPLEFGTSEEYADEARRKADDVTDLGDDPLSTPMGKWQRQSRVAGVADSDYGGRCRECGERVVEDPEYGGYFHADDDDNPIREESGHYIEPDYMPGTLNWNSFDEKDDEDPYREASIGYSTDDDSDIVRTFQAHLGDTALGAGAGQGAGRFDDIAGAAQGFLRTAGRNYSLAEQSELIREGDRGGARNLDSLDLKGTHYEDMHTLGW